MDLSDMNYWGIVVVPIGIILGFGPAMLVWWLVDRKRDQQRHPAKAGR
jgi:hypothetical protein